MREVRALCERQDFPIERCARVVDQIIRRDQAEYGFIFSAGMTFGKTCDVCGRTRKWSRKADGSVAPLASAES